MMRLRTLLLTTTALMPFFGAPAFAGPEGAVVVGGQVSVQNPGTANVTVNQFSQNAIVNWHTFNIGANERTQFVQPNSSSVILNRVTGGLGPSEILGRLDANGKVFVVNRDGFLFGAGAVINTAGFLATTSDIKNDDFMAGRYNFSIPGRSDASIVNMGTITAANGGFAGLVAPGVRNSGTITANLGTVVLGAGNIFTLDMYGDKLITLGVNDQIAGSVKDVATGQTLKSLITNEGKLKANGGRVELTAAAARQVVDSVINTSGVIEANSVGMKNGQIILGAATASTKGDGLPTQTVKISGKLSAAGKKAGTKGGTILVTGEDIQVTGANIDASGRDGGGKVMIGGDWGGGNPNTALVSNQSAQLEGYKIANATTVSVDGATKIDASAKDRGDGGKVVLWSDGTTTFAGTILALGGREFGNGGFVETSGKGQLFFLGDVNTGAPNGKAGTLLLDPADFYIVTTLGGSPVGASEMTNAQIQALLASQNVVIATNNAANPSGQNGDIFVNAPIVWNTGYSLTLEAYRNIVVNYVGVNGTAIQNTNSGDLVLRADSTGIGTGTVDLLAYTFATRIDWSTSTGKVSIYYNPTSYTSPTNYTTANGHVATNGSVPNQLTAYMLVNSLTDLQNINTNLGGTYALGKNIDATSPGFTPLGNFTGVLDGNGGLGVNYTISNLLLAPTSGAIWNIGLFGVTAIGSEVRNLNFANVNVVADSNVSAGTIQYIGPVAGQAAGTITNVHVNSGSVNGLPGLWVSAGGLAGFVSGTINNSSSAANTSVGNGGSNFNYAGGLAGRSDAGDILNSSASGAVAGGSNSYVGGLVGHNLFNSGAATIVNSSATGNVTVGVNGAGGGVVGFNTNGSVINNASSSGNVTAIGANAAIGGLVGWNAGSIANSTVTGGLVGAGALDGIAAGGLVGRNAGGISVASSAANVTIGASSASTQENNVGGLVGVNTGTIGSSSASGAVTGGAHSNVGGLVGRNETTGAIASSFATGSVSILAGAQNTAGGLVGFNFGSISNSYATGQIAGASSDANYSTMLGGLVGINDATGTITGSYAIGAVIGGTNSQAGGFVGSNNGGSISGSHATGAVSSLDNSAGGFVAFNGSGGTITNSYAAGNVTGGGNTTGGFVGDNAGTITGSYAGGSVTGSGESTGGFAGTNDGTITSSYATGNVTSTSSNGNDSVGGFVSDNNGLISGSYATGNVSGLNVLAAGGFAGSNAPGTGTINNSYATGNVTGGSNGYVAGFVGANGGDVSNSHATGNVTGGDGTVAAGFAALNYVGNITGSWASGAVTGGNDSLLGGLVGFNILGTIAQSYSTSTVSGGSDAMAGGLVGLNVGTVNQSFATGAVSGGDNSFLGGLVALNYAVTGYPTGIISQAYATGAVTGGANSYVGGLVALNGGSIDQTFAAGLLTGGTGSTLGGLVASNSFFDQVNTPTGPATVPVFSTTPGTATNSYWDTQTTGQSTSAGGTPMTTLELTSGNPPGFPSQTWSTGGGNYPCLNGICNPAPTPGPAVDPGRQDHPTSDIPVISPQLVVSANLVSDPTGPKTDGDPTPNTTPVTNPPPGPSGGQGGGQNAGRPSGNQVPPPGLGPLPSGMPPLNETRFLSNEVVMQLGTVMTPAAIAALTRSLGLEILTQQNFDVLGRTVFRFRIAGHLSVRDVIKALEANRVNVSAQPSYTYSLTQDVAQADLAGAPADINRKGDSAQYIVDKLHLVEAHTIATGKDVKVAVIDSEIDAKHPDLQGVITATYDALPSADQTPHPHGTGMAGAIASHRRLLGIAPGAKLLAVRAFGIDEKGAQGTSMNIVKGLEWAVAQGAKVINMSFAGPRDPILQQAIKKLSDDGIILIAAAGNAGPKSPPLFPGADANVIAVSATDMDDKVYKNANRGKYVAIAAPGVDILVPAPDGGYQLTTGTSVAAAHISGVAALLKERNPQLKSADVRNILSVSAKNIGPVKTDIGAGLVDPLQALTKAGPKSAELR